MNQNVRRVQKAIDEMIKIMDSGKGCEDVRHVLDALRNLQAHYEAQG